MKFQYKCLLQQFFSCVPYGQYLNYAMQRYIAKSLPQSEKTFKTRWNNAIRHRDTFKKLSNKPVEEANCYEFGAGWDLMFPLSLSSLGFSNIYCVDIRPLVMTSLVNNNIDFITKYLELADQTRVKIGGGGDKIENPSHREIW